ALRHTLSGRMRLTADFLGNRGPGRGFGRLDHAQHHQTPTGVLGQERSIGERGRKFWTFVRDNEARKFTHSCNADLNSLALQANARVAALGTWLTERRLR